MGLPAFRFDRKSAAILGGVLLVSTLVRLLAWQFHPIVSVDGTTYIRLARYLVGGPFIDTQQPPGYPALIALVLPLAPAGDSVVAARLVDLVCGILLLIPFFLMARRSFGAWPAGIVTLLLGLTPLAIRYSVTTMSESPYVLFVLLSVLAATRKRDGLAGALSGIAFLVRPEGIVLPGALAVARGVKPRAWLLLALGFLAFGAVPAILFNHHTTGRWTLTRKVVNITGDDFWRNEVENTMQKRRDPGLLDRVRANSGAIARSYPDRLLAELSNLGRSAGWPFVAALGPGLMVAAARLPAAGLAQALFVPLFPGVPPVARLVLPLLPFVLYFGFALARRLGEREAKGAGNPWATWSARLVVAILIGGWLVAAVPEAGNLRMHEDGFYPELVAAGEAMKSIVTSSTLIFDRKPYTAFYAGTRYETTPLGSYQETVDEILKRKGDYLVVDESVTEYFRPALLPLVRDSATMLGDPRLDLVYFDPTYKDRHVAIYRVVRPGGPPPMPGPGLDQLRGLIATRIPHDPALHGLHAELLALAGRTEEAIAEYEKAVQVNPRAEDLSNLAALLLERGRDARRALELAEQAARLEPSNGAYQLVVVRARTAAGLVRP
jgi:hypothetical protein